MTAQEAAKLRQDIVALQRALMREQMDRRALEHRVKQLEAAVGGEHPALDRPNVRTAAA